MCGWVLWRVLIAHVDHGTPITTSTVVQVNNANCVAIPLIRTGRYRLEVIKRPHKRVWSGQFTAPTGFWILHGGAGCRLQFTVIASQLIITS